MLACFYPFSILISTFFGVRDSLLDSGLFSVGQNCIFCNMIGFVESSTFTASLSQCNIGVLSPCFCVPFDNDIAIIVDMVVFLRLRQFFICQDDFIFHINDDMGTIRHGEGHAVAFVLDFLGVWERFFDFRFQVFLGACQLAICFSY